MIAIPAFVVIFGASTALRLDASNVVTDWNAFASTTIVKNAGKASAASGVWFAYTGIAIYDAVNAITGQYRPLNYRGRGPAAASIEAAAVAAAHRILVNYFPAQRNDLDEMYTLALLKIDAPTKKSGVDVEEAAAAALITARSGDGLEASVTYTPGTGAGAWVPTPPAFAAPGYALARSNAAIHHEDGRRSPAGRVHTVEQRTVEKRLQLDSCPRR
jgi:hypothetical protein